ncbi:MAG TPA: phage portal protein [Candidatus Cloacimonadota bacterium]|nr:phage portal protein [Candidatus Cloacimonadota bacterium]
MKFYVVKGAKAAQREKLDKGRPYDVQELVEAYYRNSWHATCVNLKTICILGDGIEDEAAVAKLTECVREDSLFTLLEKTILDLRVFGDAFWEVVRSGGSVELYHMPSWTMERNPKGGWTQALPSGRVDFPEESVWHFREPSLLSQVWGSPDYMPLINDGTLAAISTIKSYNSNFFRNNAIPDGILFIKGGDVSPDTESGLRRFFREKFWGVENASKFCLAPVPEGVEVQLEKLQDHQDGKFLTLQDSLVMEIVSCHGVPPRLAGIMIPGSLGGGGEAAGELKIFLQTRIKPLQNIFGGQLDRFFMEVLQMQTDISFKAFDILPSEAESAIQFLKS